MSDYNEEEQKELNRQLTRWQKRQIVAVKQDHIDRAFESMTDIDRKVWEIIANAKNYKSVSWLIWNQAERVISKYCKLAR